MPRLSFYPLQFALVGALIFGLFGSGDFKIAQSGHRTPEIFQREH